MDGWLTLAKCDQSQGTWHKILQSFWRVYSWYLFFADEEIEIELLEEEAAFLQGQTKLSVNVSPVKIVKVRYRGLVFSIKGYSSNSTFQS